MAKDNVTAARLRELLHYDAETGVFSRLVALRGGRRGPIRPSASGNGYQYISVDGNSCLAHRLAWLYVHGAWPVEDIDHINGVRTDNRLCNLRSVARYVNNQNRHRVRSDNVASGATGVSWHIHSRKWRARIWLQGVEHRVGLFDTIEEASAAYVTAKRRLHAGCTI